MSDKPKLTYWPIRGLAAPIRAALIYSDIAFTDDRTTAWYDGISEEIAKVNPLCNNPCLTLPSGQVICQSWAVLQYVGRQGPLKPANDLEQIRVDEVIGVLQEFFTEKMKASYPKEAKENIPSFITESCGYYLDVLEKYMTINGTSFLATAQPSIVDIFLTEQLDGVVLKMAPGESAGLMAKFPKVFGIYAAMKANPKLQAFYEAEKDVPFNSAAYAAWW